MSRAYANLEHVTAWAPLEQSRAWAKDSAERGQRFSAGSLAPRAVEKCESVLSFFYCRFFHEIKVLNYCTSTEARLSDADDVRSRLRALATPRELHLLLKKEKEKRVTDDTITTMNGSCNWYIKGGGFQVVHINTTTTIAIQILILILIRLIITIIIKIVIIMIVRPGTKTRPSVSHVNGKGGQIN